jgi:hypothetical protein
MTEEEKLLKEWLDINDTPCRYDHHGYCQEHYLEKDEYCIVLRTRLLLEKKFWLRRIGENSGQL